MSRKNRNRKDRKLRNQQKKDKFNKIFDLNFNSISEQEMVFKILKEDPYYDLQILIKALKYTLEIAGEENICIRVKEKDFSSLRSRVKLASEPVSEDEFFLYMHNNTDFGKIGPMMTIEWI